jgi:hypothetical protein
MARVPLTCALSFAEFAMVRRALLPLCVLAFLLNPTARLAQDEKPAHPAATELRELAPPRAARCIPTRWKR